MREQTTVREVAGPWSLGTSRAFWEGFTPAALRDQSGGELRSVFVAERDWTPVTTTVRQDGTAAHITVAGRGDLPAAADQVARFLALDVDARGWPAVGDRDPVIAAAQRALPGLRPCGFHSPYEAAAWAVLSQRVRMTQAARMRSDLTDRLGEQGAFPAPDRLRTEAPDLDLPDRKPEYLRAVAEAALDGLLDGPTLRGLTVPAAESEVRQVKGIGPFAAELVVLRGANHPDGVPQHERRLDAEIAARYGPAADREQITARWAPFRTWAAVHLRALAESPA
jgi:DNA-3-methyladenine glycosylase II